jgi:hypothetical protein
MLSMLFCIVIMVISDTNVAHASVHSKTLPAAAPTTTVTTKKTWQTQVLHQEHTPYCLHTHRHTTASNVISVAEWHILLDISIPRR